MSTLTGRAAPTAGLSRLEPATRRERRAAGPARAGSSAAPPGGGSSGPGDDDQGGAGSGGDGPANRAPETASETRPRRCAPARNLLIDLSDTFDGAALAHGAESSDTSVATVAVDGGTLTVRGVGRGAGVAVTATDA